MFIRWSTLTTVLLAVFLFVTNAQASVVSVDIGSFGASSTLTTFTGLANGTEVNGLTVDGINFSYSLGNGQVVIDGGPGITNNIVPPNVVSVGNNTGVLSMALPSFVSLFGYGYAVLNATPVLNATTISLFSGATPVGSLSYNAVPDPTFAGGFAGIESTIPFDIVTVTFNSVSAPAFALDNIRTSAAAVPESSTLLLFGAGIAALFFYGRSSRRDGDDAMRTTFD